MNLLQFLGEVNHQVVTTFVWNDFNIDTGQVEKLGVGHSVAVSRTQSAAACSLCPFTSHDSEVSGVHAFSLDLPISHVATQEVHWSDHYLVKLYFKYFQQNFQRDNNRRTNNCFWIRSLKAGTFQSFQQILQTQFLLNPYSHSDNAAQKLSAFN